MSALSLASHWSRLTVCIHFASLTLSNSFTILTAHASSGSICRSFLIEWFQSRFFWSQHFFDNFHLGHLWSINRHSIFGYTVHSKVLSLSVSTCPSTHVERAFRDSSNLCRPRSHRTHSTSFTCRFEKWRLCTSSNPAYSNISCWDL